MKPFRTTIVEISTVTPMRNELTCVREFVRRVDAVMQALSDEYEIIIVDDGSTDGTGELLDELTAAYPHLRPVHLTRNFGQAIATDAGFQQSSGRFVVMLDGDLEQPPEEIPRLIEEARKGFDLVSGRRINRDINTFLRVIPSRMANWLLRRSTGCQVRDMGGMKCLRGDIARELRLRAGQHRFLPALVHLLGGRVTEIPVDAHRRFSGQSHYGISRTFDVFLDVIYFACQTSSKGRPMYSFGRLGLGLSAVTGLLLMLTALAFFSGAATTAWPLLLLTVLGGSSSLAAIVCGVGLELLSESHAGILDRRHLRIASSESVLAEVEASAEPLRRAA
ncbi:dolichol-phosphate mannosyltransferase [Planctomycetia bacterium]|nr:dolichol-phosphate mannosyltransferase [Planctomycetia bacterium]